MGIYSSMIFSYPSWSVDTNLESVSGFVEDGKIVCRTGIGSDIVIFMVPPGTIIFRFQGNTFSIIILSMYTDAHIHLKISLTGRVGRLSCRKHADMRVGLE